MADWTLSPGDKIRRTDLHRLFGGRRQGGVSPSAQSPNIFLFSDPASGEQHGYFDGWKLDGHFHYTGEGQRGDQEMTDGNRAIFRASIDGRALRVFKGTGGTVTYQGQFELANPEPWYTTDAPETGGAAIRSVIVFRLQPLDSQPERPMGLPPPEARTTVTAVPVEEHNTEKAYVDPAREPYEAERRESQLVQRFKQHMEANGHKVKRLKIMPAGEAKPIFTDLHLEDAGMLVEAKGSTDRVAIRMAIGQLVDYRRFVDTSTRCAVLLPSLPRADLIKLIHAAGMAIYYPEGATFKIEVP